MSVVEDGWLMPAPPAERFGLTELKDLEWVDSMMPPMALGCFTEKASMIEPPEGLPTAYLRTAWPNASLDVFHDRGRRRGWTTQIWSTGHDMMIEAPQRTVDFLLKVLSNSA